MMSDDKPRFQRTEKNRRFWEPLEFIYVPSPPNRYEQRQADSMAYRDALLRRTAKLTQQLEPVLPDISLHSDFVANLLALMKTAQGEDALKAFYTLRQSGLFSDEVLRKVSLAGTNLAAVVLTDAVLTGSDLSNCDLTGAYLARVDLRGANLSRANLSWAVLEAVNLSEAVLDGANLSECWLDNSKADNATLQRASLNHANLRNAIIGDDLRFASLQHTDLRETWLYGVDFRGANLTGANILNIVQEVVRWGFDTILPDGNPCSKANYVDKYTDSRDPNFWQPDIAD
jgi:uncharacterized protein YjbI with pentapeptide repeats